MFTQGQVGVNKQGLAYVILDAQRMKKIKIKFDIDGAEVVTTKSYLLQGLPMHPTHGKWKPGDTFEDKNSEEFSLVEKVGIAKWRIRYTKDGAECERETSSIKDKYGSHPIDNKILQGNKYKTSHGFVTVLEVKNSSNILVQFEDGTTTTVQSQPLRIGSVGHPTSGLVIGRELKTNSGWLYTIDRYVSPREVYVRMQDGSIERVSAKEAKIGSFKPCNQPSVCGIGFIGQGRFSNLQKKLGEKAPEVIFSYWHRMVSRCFNPGEIIKNKGQRYLFASIDSSWFNFQNFAEWALSQPNWDAGHDLDKDLLGSNLEYSAKNCTFLPSDVNGFLAENWSKTTHNLPLGVQYIQPGTSGAKVGYVARCHTGNGREYLGYFDDQMEAYYAYKRAKEAYAHVLAEKYKDTITEQAYDALKRFKITKVYPDAPYACSSLQDSVTV